MSIQEKRRISNLEHVFIRYNKGEAIVHEGELDPTFYILIHGKAIVSKQHYPNRILAKLTPGMIFGEMGFLANQPRSTDVTALSDETVVMRIDEKTLFDLRSSIRDRIKDGLIQILVGRINRMNNALLKYAKWEKPDKEPIGQKSEKATDTSQDSHAGEEIGPETFVETLSSNQ
ncbi:MAG: cyclic nucleotide-binding domain-containing protein [Magnetococcales bacterium]|nr:cyclic nucleotide-binding domain-containing protein [Magnetococcales bacterium]